MYFAVNHYILYSVHIERIRLTWANFRVNILRRVCLLTDLERHGSMTHWYFSTIRVYVHVLRTCSAKVWMSALTFYFLCDYLLKYIFYITEHIYSVLGGHRHEIIRVIIRYIAYIVYLCRCTFVLEERLLQ